MYMLKKLVFSIFQVFLVPNTVPVSSVDFVRG